MPVKKHLIRFENVNVAYQIDREEVMTLHEINVHIYPEEFTIVYGPSGSGKSTFLNTLVGLERPHSGEIYMRGYRMSSLDDDSRADFRNKNIGMVYQQAHWVKTLNVLDNVALPLHLGGKDATYSYERAIYALKQVNMDKLAKRNPMQLSGGQQQRVSIARALVSDPFLIVADEPTGNLDTNSANEILTLLLDLVQNYGRTVIMVTHDMRFLNHADRAIMIKDGQVAHELDKEGVKQIMKNYQEPLEILS